jgi:hypothetical protein
MFLIEARRTSRKVNMSSRLCGNLNDEPTLARPVASKSFIRRRYVSRVLFSVPHFCHQCPSTSWTMTALLERVVDAGTLHDAYS